MAGFELSAEVNADNVFLVKHSELEGRWDIDYYRPKINALEKKIRQKTTKKLKDFIVKLASGATPSVQEEAKFYSTKGNGIPFLRVQNLNVSGEVGLDDVKYINQDTHHNYLKRSQVSAHDLLVKITGVGRMAIASVVPSGFDGNTNQHMVVIKTGGEAQSRYLANYLNLDIIEVLATRRPTGATRPALDYPALKSIPVIEGIDFSLLKKAEAQKQQKEQQAQALLDGIDGYLLNALGITLPKQDNRLEKRMFTVPFSEVTGGSLSPDNFLKRKKLYSSSKYEFYSLDALATMYQPQTITQQDMLSNGTFKVYGANGQIGYFDKYNHENPEVLITCRGATCGEINLSEPKSWITGNAMVVKLNVNFVSQNYLFEILKCLDLSVVITGSAQPQITRQNLKKFSIPIPPIEKQTEIAAHIMQIRAQAKQLQAEAANLLTTAKAEIERMILGET